MWNKFKAALWRFMQGRYGIDALGNCLMWVYLALLIIGMITGLWPITLLASLLAVYMLFRIFSRNRTARMAENTKFLGIKSRFSGWSKLQKAKRRDRKTHVFKKCPKCKADIRLPKVKGDHTVKCPRCGERFPVKIN